MIAEAGLAALWLAAAFAALQLALGALTLTRAGAGEGGPALALLHRDAIEDVTAALDAGYYGRNPISGPGPHLQVCVFGPGAHRLDRGLTGS